MRLLLLLALASIGCSARPPEEPSPRSAPDPSPPRAPALASSNANEAEGHPPAEAAQSAESAESAGGACLMWYVCGCNVGCSAVAEPRASLGHGLRVTVVSGVQAGKPAFVHQSKDAGGDDVFSLAPYGPDDPVLCARPDPHLIGYACETSKSGDLDGHACDAGCER